MKPLRFYQFYDVSNPTPFYYIALRPDNNALCNNPVSAVELDMISRPVVKILEALTKVVEEDNKREIVLDRIGNARGGGRIIDYIKYVQEGKDINALVMGTASRPKDVETEDGFIFEFVDDIIKVCKKHKE